MPKVNAKVYKVKSQSLISFATYALPPTYLSDVEIF